MNLISMQTVPLKEPKVVFDSDYQHIVRLIAYVLKMDEVGHVEVFGLDEDGLITARSYDDGGFVPLKESYHVGSLLYKQMYEAIVFNHGLCENEAQFQHYLNSFGIRVFNND